MVEGKQIDEKSFQWFGATVRSSGEDGIILACAPRYTWFSANRKRRDPVGTCFVAKDSFTEFVEYSPCRTTKWGYHRQGSCQVGLGADVDSAGRRLFLGAVGSWYWQGQLFLVDSKKSGEGNTVPFIQFRQNQGQVYSQGLAARPDIRWTREGPNWDDDSYLGYSVASGEFSGDKDSDVVVGMPRGANLTGKVIIYSSDLTNLHNITGEQIGSYFGYAVAVVDVDGDGLDDIVIGAPMHTDFGDPSMKIETGKVYVVYQTKRHKFKKWEAVDGTVHRGRFGLSLCALGDINLDGFKDFAVGAPYGGDNGRGAVYIYQGMATGLRKPHTQVIYAEQLAGNVQTFGFSLSGGKDLDGNGYPDLLVGAYDSDYVAYLKSKPVVRVNAKLTFSAHDQQAGGGVDLNSKQINLEEKSCTLRDNTKVTCLPLNLCMEYDGIGADDTIDFQVQSILDSKKPKEPRMYFLNSEGFSSMNQTLRLYKKRKNCANVQVYLRPNIRDKLTPLEAELKYSMITVTRTVDRQRRSLSAVIDATTSSIEKDSVSIEKNCGSDNICIPDLSVKVSMSEKSFLIGSTERINIEVEVKNLGEDSYESMLYMTVPPSLAYVSVDRLDTNKKVPVLCSPPAPSTNNTLRCEIGNPLPRSGHVKFKLYFQPRLGSEVKSDYVFNIVVNSTNPEASDVARTDNIKSITLPVRIQTDLSLRGVSQNEPVRHNATLYKQETVNHEREVGPEVVHVYEIRCDGPSSIENADILILWPSFTKEGDHFLYLLEQPHTEGAVTCEHVDDANPLELIINRNMQFSSVKNRSIGIDQEESHASSSISGATSGSNEFSSSSNTHYEQTFSSGGGSYSKTSKSSYGEKKSEGKVFQTSDELDEYIRKQGLDRRDFSESTTRSGSYPVGESSSGSRSFTSETRTHPSETRSYGSETSRSYQSPSHTRSYSSESRSYPDTRFYSSESRSYPGQTRHYSSFDRTSSSTSSSDSSFRNPNNLFPNYERNRRSLTGGWRTKDTNCGPVKCIHIKCKIGELDAGQSVVIALRGRVWSRTLQEKFQGENMNVSSKLLTKVTHLPYNVDPSYLKYKSNEIFSTVVEESELTTPGKVRWWIYLLAALAGLLLLLLLIYALYKCGFFKRRRPRHGPEGQPLNRNGYHPGDERL
ncbi:unnamed protein product [Allacma fusca]|uniref:Integrin alpha-2 domain-containing protein n=1 Tax=Allacma fusca TaxID=39272 RepID=A0A8J2LNY4_9HEXA|nr:unnamed protein product [Allacma fusca]